MLPGELLRIPQFTKTVMAYVDTIGCVVGSEESKNAFLFTRSLSDWETLIKAGHANADGLPVPGFMEMKQDVYDIARRLDNGDSAFPEDEAEE